MIPETKRLADLWKEEAKKSAEGLPADSPEREHILKATQEGVSMITDLARWDKNEDPRAREEYSTWKNKTDEWVKEGEKESSNPDRKKWDEKVFDGVVDEVDVVQEEKGQRRQILLDIARADIYLSAGGVEPDFIDEAFACLDQAIEACHKVTYFNVETQEMEMHPMNKDLAELAQGKIDAITKVLNFLNENAKKPE